MKIEIKKTGINGEGIGYLNRKPVFVSGCFPGEIVEVTITSRGEKYSRGRADKIIKRSAHRVESPCAVSSLCGSCPFINLDYRTQLQYKEEILSETLRKYCGFKGRFEHMVASEQLYYRNKVNMPVLADKKGKLYNAMYRPNSNTPVQIDKCVMHDGKLEQVRIEVLKVLNRFKMKPYDNREKTGIRQLVVRGFDEFQVVLITGRNTITYKLSEAIMAIKGVVSLYQGVNTRKNPVSLMPDNITLIAGKPEIDLHICGYDVTLHPQAFFQLNGKQGASIYEKVRELICEEVFLAVEAYCGVGVMSLLIHDKCKEVIGIELDRRAVESARKNAEINGIENVSFKCGDAGSELIRLSRKKKPDLLIADPPRTGLSDEFIECILKSDIKQIIYVSCNPATLARNIRDLESRYYRETVIPYDMFPNTPHIETVVSLKRK